MSDANKFYLMQIILMMTIKNKHQNHTDIIRAFFAIDLSQDDKNRVECAFMPMCQHMASTDIYAIPSRGLHITLLYLGFILKSQVTELIAEANRQIKSPSFQLDFLSCEYFPSLNNPSVIAFLPAFSKEIIDLQNQIKVICASCNLSPNSLPFKPHLTVAKVKKRHIYPYPWPIKKIESITVSQVVLFESIGHSNYKNLGTIILK